MHFFVTRDEHPVVARYMHGLPRRHSDARPSRLVQEPMAAGAVGEAGVFFVRDNVAVNELALAAFGAFLGLPFSAVQRRLSERASRRRSEKSLAETLRNVMNDLNTSVVRQQLPQGTTPQWPAWRDGLEEMLMDEPFFERLAERRSGSSSGETLSEINADLVERVMKAVDPDRELDDDAQLKLADTLIQLRAPHHQTFRALG